MYGYMDNQRLSATNNLTKAKDGHLSALNEYFSYIICKVNMFYVNKKAHVEPHLNVVFHLFYSITLFYCYNVKQ